MGWNMKSLIILFFYQLFHVSEDAVKISLVLLQTSHYGLILWFKFVNFVGDGYQKFVIFIILLFIINMVRSFFLFSFLYHFWCFILFISWKKRNKDWIFQNIFNCNQIVCQSFQEMLTLESNLASHKSCECKSSHHNDWKSIWKTTYQGARGCSQN